MLPEPLADGDGEESDGRAPVVCRSSRTASSLLGAEVLPEPLFESRSSCLFFLFLFWVWPYLP